MASRRSKQACDIRNGRHYIIPLAYTGGTYWAFSSLERPHFPLYIHFVASSLSNFRSDRIALVPHDTVLPKNSFPALSGVHLGGEVCLTVFMGLGGGWFVLVHGFGILEGRLTFVQGNNRKSAILCFMFIYLLGFLFFETCTCVWGAI